MHELVHPLRSSDYVRSGLDDRDIRTRAARGELARLAPGVYLEAAQWRALDDRGRYVAKVAALVDRLSRPVAISHWSAAAVVGLPHADGWPSRVEVTDSGVVRSRSTATLLRREGALRAADVELWGDLWVTTAARTAADLALTEPFENAVVVLDHGLRHGMFSRDDVREHLSLLPRAKRLPTALRAVDFASEKAEYAGESFSRVGMAVRGFVASVLQQPFRDRLGLIGNADFWFPEVGIVGEFDGDWKYTDPRWLRGRTAAEAIIDEKRRQARLEAHPLVRRVVRWDYAVARNPDELARRLASSGVPRVAAPLRRSRGS
ncbi:hypothetical protein [Frondihabitans australicus]|uniref:Uncharacterized protein n=1 Tax=Frondihabitans australicus TaxID=386892 RepID=A0A495IGU4_9MICO|nr:hypothetical protein [Frondihabitans australicus]RKR75207.1 hypothetical protein C8E83_2345 [Frondihabitans australicus]